MSALPANLEELAERAEEMALLLRAVAHPARLLVLCSLAQGERGVSDIEEVTGVRQPMLSRELGKLRESGLITPRRQSKAVFYQLKDPRANALLSALCASADLPRAAPAPQGRSAFAGRSSASVFARVGGNDATDEGDNS